MSHPSADGPTVHAEGDASVSLTLTAMAHGGAALGREADGRVVFVSGGIPGETVTARVTESGPRHAKAELGEILSDPSPDRVENPPCPYYRSWPERGDAPERACGGCHWQHVRYEAQLGYKREVVADALRRLGGIADPNVRPTVGMEDPWRYRNRLTVRASGGGAGLVARDDVTIVPIASCAIAHPLVMALADALDAEIPGGMAVVLRASAATGDQLILLRDPNGDLDDISVDAPVSVVLESPRGLEVVAGNPHLVDALAGRRFLIPAGSFFQVNTAMAEGVVRLLREALAPGTGLLVDAFSGVGTFAVLLADLAREVVAIESDAAAVAAAVDNASGVENLTLLEGDAAEGLAYLARPPDVLLVDPPRTGLPRAFVQAVARLRPNTIMYVSCEPSTLARDARQLVGSGWRLEWCRPVDMFPHTFHVETVSRFRR